MKKSIAQWMEESVVTFGTSGARGLVTAMTDAVCYAYTLGFLQYLRAAGKEGTDPRIAIAGDRRSSSPRILAAVAAAARDFGYTPVYAGLVPTPAIALLGLQDGIPSVMVTGSHIPDDRNGIKYNTPFGEVLKEDEAGMKAQEVALPDVFDEGGMFRTPPPLPPESDAAANAYLARWRDAFPADFLAGLHLGVYQHSAVGRDLLVTIYEALGARVTPLARSASFLPVDTEAIRPEDVQLAEGWAATSGFDAILSTDGDSDRPLISDERGRWLRGDIAGILTADFLQADVVCTPVSCNTALELSGRFPQTRRTRIGSPFVIAAMLDAVANGAARVVGYEANGGFLTATPIPLPAGRILPPLPTRDPVIVHLAVLGLARARGCPVSALPAALPPRITASDRVQNLPTTITGPRIDALAEGGAPAIQEAWPVFGEVAATDRTDGLRITFRSGEIVHLRPSGNAPELRCYTEAATEERAREINRTAMEILRGWVGTA